ncbi:MAG: gfo/Idh/MocA family oxidoreductase [Chitinivibrionales bacterium]|nr:gfo/Idh/MocA family oxidoreductase [Chitinivibrionales bacterium]
MSEDVRVVLSGLGGYGEHYLWYLLDKAPAHVRLVAGVDPSPQRCSRLADLRARGVSVYGSLDDALHAHAADLTIVAAPHHYHADQSCLALGHGSHVLCEKPLCATLADARRMLDTRDKAQRHVGIGYQWSFSPAVQSLKAAIGAGDFGQPQCLKTLVLWPRDRRYYARNGWAGRIAMPDGTPVLDSPVNNATAHFLHNMLYLLGPAVDRSACPQTLTAELYRAHEIENYDTAMLRCTLGGGTEVLFCTTHASRELYGPVFELRFDSAVVRYDGHAITATMSDGSTRKFGSPEEKPHAKVESMVQAIRGEHSPECGIEAALSQTICMLGAQQARAIVDFVPQMVHTERDGDNSRRWVDGLDSAMKECYSREVLPSEAGCSWAVPGASLDLSRLYREIPGFA